MADDLPKSIDIQPEISWITVKFIQKQVKTLQLFKKRLPDKMDKASLTSNRMCTYVLVTEKNRLICKGHLTYM